MQIIGTLVYIYIYLFQKRRIFDIYNLYSLHVGTFMHMYHHEILPRSFLNVFQTGSQVHNYSTDMLNYIAPKSVELTSNN